MSAHTRIRPARGLQRFVWRALRLRRWMTTGSLVSISGGDGVTGRHIPQNALSRAGIVCRGRAGRKTNWRLVRDLGPQATHL